MTKNRGPGKSARKGICLIDLANMFQDMLTTERWFEKIRSADETCCNHCQSDNLRLSRIERPAEYEESIRVLSSL